MNDSMNIVEVGETLQYRERDLADDVDVDGAVLSVDVVKGAGTRRVERRKSARAPSRVNEATTTKQKGGRGVKGEGHGAREGRKGERKNATTTTHPRSICSMQMQMCGSAMKAP